MISMWRVAALFLLPLAALGASESVSGRLAPVRIGVLSEYTKERCQSEWGPTAAYLTEKIPGYAFSISPLDYPDVVPAAEYGRVDFVICDPGLYVELEQRCNALRIATLKRPSEGRQRATCGAVVFFRADRNDITTLRDLAGKRLLATNEHSFEGWYVPWREFKERGMDPYRDLKELRFVGYPEAVVYGVRDRLADAGTVRADTFERMTTAGQAVSKDAFRFLEFAYAPQDLVDLPARHSTRPYPEWPICKLRHISSSLAEQVLAALLRLPPDGEVARAAHSSGWTYPLLYTGVRDCLEELNVGQTSELAKVSTRRVLRRITPYLYAAVVLLAGILLGAGYVHHLNLRLTSAMAAQKRELESRKLTENALREAYEAHETLEHIIDYSPAVCILLQNDIDWPIEFVSHNIHQFGYGAEEFLEGRRRFLDIVHPADRTRAASELIDYAKVGQDRFVQEYRILMKNGAPRWIESHVVARRDAEGRITHYQSLLLDVTARHPVDAASETAGRLVEEPGVTLNEDGRVTGPNSMRTWRTRMANSPAAKTWPVPDEDESPQG